LNKTLRVILCTSFVLCAFAQSSIAGNEDTTATSISPATEQPKHNILKNFVEDEGDIWTSPLRMDWHDAAIVGGIAATTAVLIASDESIYQNFRTFHDNNSWVRTASPIASQFGEFYVPFGIAALYCAHGLAFHNDYNVDTGLLAAQAMIHSGIVVQVFKHLFGRTRPFVRNGRDHWFGPSAFFRRYTDGGFSPYDSFPSGHTITAFSLATVIAERSDKWWVDGMAYSFAGLCGLSRLTERDHWFSGVFVGAAMGIAIGKLVVHNQEKRLELSPVIGSRSVGLAIQLNY
jgi:membrane-associated phospholipid phosphatase